MATIDPIDKIKNNTLFSIPLEESEGSCYYFGRLVWEGMATFADIENWVYSMDDLNVLHEMLDLRDRLQMKAEAQYG